MQKPEFLFRGLVSGFGLGVSCPLLTCGVTLRSFHAPPSMAAAAAASPVNSMASVCRAHLASCDVVVMANAPWAAAAASPQDNNDAMATLATLIAANFGGTCIVACDTDARAWALSSLHDTPSAAAAGTGVGGLDGRVSCRVIERSSASFFTSPL